MNVSDPLQQLDRRVTDALGEVDPRFDEPLRQAKRHVERGVERLGFERDRLQRRRDHRELYAPDRADQQPLRDLRRHGIAVLRDVFTTEQLGAVRTPFEQLLDDGRSLENPPDDRERPPEQRDRTPRRLSDEELAEGQDAFRNWTNRITLADPLLTIPELLPLVFERRFFDMASAYLHTVPALGSVTLRKSYANDLPALDTQLFHVDPNSPKFVKFFVYLHDVDRDGGPFCYVRTSHRRRFPGWIRHQRWHEHEILEHYPEEALAYGTARAGDVVVADTTGFHRGTPPATADRCLITISYTVHPEFGGAYNRTDIAAEDLAAMHGWQRAAAEQLRPTPSGTGGQPEEGVPSGR